jgi:hypothetical protein
MRMREDSMAKRLWKSGHVEKLLGMGNGSGKTLDSARNRGLLDIPFIRIGKRIRFDPDAVRKWLAEHTITPAVSERDSIDGRARQSRRLRA